MSAIITVLICVAIYFVPTSIAANKHRENVGAIFAFNLFFGWTFIGWLIALIWALTHAPRVRA